MCKLCVAQVEGVVAWPVEIGPEFIHGAKTSLKVTSVGLWATQLIYSTNISDKEPLQQALIEETNSSLREFEWPDCWYFGKERRLISSNVKARDLCCACISQAGFVVIKVCEDSLTYHKL